MTAVILVLHLLSKILPDTEQDIILTKEDFVELDVFLSNLFGRKLCRCLAA